MSGTVWRSAAAVALLAAVAAAGARAQEATHQRKAVKLLGASQSTYRVVQEGAEVGKESFERRTYDDNTIVFQADITLDATAGARQEQKIDFKLEEESYFPISYHSVKHVSFASGGFDHVVSLEMVSNVAVIDTELRGVHETRRLVVPVGIAVHELGAVLYWYQTLFWYDRGLGGRQRFQWLDPVSGKVGSGEMRRTEDQTLTVMGKKTPVSVFKAEREALGEATLYVDGKGRIVKCEQNMTTFELVRQVDK